MKTRNKGFTLVEIAIVLVIIGLLLGGILKGQEMITQAKIKNVIADFTGISAAYLRLPGPLPRACPGDDTGRGTVAGPAAAVLASRRATATASSKAPTTAPPPTSRVNCGGIICAAQASSPAGRRRNPFNAARRQDRRADRRWRPAPACSPLLPARWNSSPGSSCARPTCRTRSRSRSTRRWTTANGNGTVPRAAQKGGAEPGRRRRCADGLLREDGTNIYVRLPPAVSRTLSTMKSRPRAGFFSPSRGAAGPPRRRAPRAGRAAPPRRRPAARPASVASRLMRTPRRRTARTCTLPTVELGARALPTRRVPAARG